MANPEFEPKQSVQRFPCKHIAVIMGIMGQCMAKWGNRGRTLSQAKREGVGESFSGVITSKLDAVGVNQRKGSGLEAGRRVLGGEGCGGGECSRQKEQYVQRPEGTAELGTVCYSP